MWTNENAQARIVANAPAPATQAAMRLRPDRPRGSCQAGTASVIAAVATAVTLTSAALAGSPPGPGGTVLAAGADPGVSSAAAKDPVAHAQASAVSAVRSARVPAASCV